MGEINEPHKAGQANESSPQPAHDSEEKAPDAQISLQGPQEKAAPTRGNEQHPEPEDRRADPAWVAANAARDSADYAFWLNWISVAGLIIGAVTMFAAGAAAYFAWLASREAKRSADAAIGSHDAFVSAEDANLFVEFLRSEIPSEAKDDQPTGGVHNLGLRIKNIGRSTAHIEGWEIPGKTHRQEHTLSAGENWDRMKPIPFAAQSGNIVHFSILYTSPIRRRMKLHMQGMLLTKQDRHDRWWVFVKILATDLQPATD